MTRTRRPLPALAGSALLLTGCVTGGINVPGLSDDSISGMKAPVIETARRVTYLALGESKKEILPKVMRSKSQALDFPAGRLHSIEGMTEYYLDKAAAQGLPPNLCQPA